VKPAQPPLFSNPPDDSHTGVILKAGKEKSVVQPLQRLFLLEEYEMKKTEFETMIDKAFWGLEGKYGFKKTNTSFGRSLLYHPISKYNH